MKQCRKCGETKTCESFGANTKNKDGLKSYCKACLSADEKARYRAKPGEIKERIRQHRLDNIGIYRARDNERWHKRKADRSEYIGNYHAARRGYMPSWANAERIKEFYASAEALRMHTGEWYVVDHIVPLKSKIVCGLHNEFNLQILTNAANSSKQNRHWPDMP